MSDRPLSAWALACAAILRDGGEDGTPYGDLREALGRPPQSILEELRRHRYVIGEQHDTFFLVVDPSVSSDPVAPVTRPPSGVSGDIPRPAATGSLDTGQLTLDAVRAA